MDQEQNIVRWHILFSGQVQAVGFRYTSQYYAQDLGLVGWVRNLYDERVEMEVQGPVSQIRKLIILLQNHRPIHIDDYYVTEIALREGEKKFSILPTY